MCVLFHCLCVFCLIVYVYFVKLLMCGFLHCVCVFGPCIYMLQEKHPAFYNNILTDRRRRAFGRNEFNVDILCKLIDLG